jgi:hypothetical protein
MVQRASVPYRGRVRMHMHFRRSLLVLVLALVWLPPASAADTLHAVCGTRPRPEYPAATAPPVVQVWQGYVRDTCKKVSQGCGTRLGADTLDDRAHYGTADPAC